MQKDIYIVEMLSFAGSQLFWFYKKWIRLKTWNNHKIIIMVRFCNNNIAPTKKQKQQQKHKQQNLQILIWHTVYSMKSRQGGTLGTEGGGEIQLSGALRQNAFMTPAGVAFCYLDSVPLLSHHPSINPAAHAQSISTLHLSVPIRRCRIPIICLLTSPRTKINTGGGARKCQKG